jgi:hypothetical protein
VATEKFQHGVEKSLKNRLLGALYTLAYSISPSQSFVAHSSKGYFNRYCSYIALLFSLGLLSISLNVTSSTEISLSTEKLSANAWSAEGVQVSLEPTELGFKLWANISSFEHQSLPKALEGIVLQCPDLRHDATAYYCEKGELEIAVSPYGRQRTRASLRYVDQDHFSLNADHLILAGGRLQLALQVIAGNWKLKLSAHDLDLMLLRQQLKIEIPPLDWVLSGNASLTAGLSGSLEEFQDVALSALIKRLNYTDQEGLQVAENGGIHLELTANRSADYWSGTIAVDLQQGQFYSDPYYLDLNPAPASLHVKLEGQWLPEQKRLQVDQARLGLLPAIEAQGSLSIDLSDFEVERARVRFETDRLDMLYKTLFQPILIGSMIDELDLSGGLQAEITIDHGILDSFHGSLEQVSLDDQRGGFALHGLNGALFWSEKGEAKPSRIQAEAGHIYQIPLGPVSVYAQSKNSEIALLKPVNIPLLGGNIRIGHFKTQGLFSDAPGWETSAEVSRLSLQELAKAFGWPAVAGELNGILPAMHYREHTLKLDGTLQVDVFSGRIQVDQLMVKQPLGRVPELFAAVQFAGLDLEQITRTFSFGHIEGGLDGWVRGLHLMNWEPVAFQARFHSPQNDQLPHRISQRAVDNLTSIGNGVGSGLSSTFLGVFKEFRYNRIELKAKLDGNLAELGGIDHPDGGYYLVKGAGLPRIDVIARNRRVAWKTLLERLKNIRVEGMEVR